MENKEFDKWRESKRNNRLTFQEDKAFTNKVLKEYPQKMVGHSEINRWLERLGKTHLNILELGCYSADGANYYTKNLVDKRITYNWDGYDISSEGFNTVEHNDKIKLHELDNQFWNSGVDVSKYDVLIATEFFEHLTASEFKKLLEYVKNIPVIIGSCPLNETKNEWKNYGGTHVLDLSIFEFEDEFTKAGYISNHLKNGLFYFEKDKPTERVSIIIASVPENEELLNDTIKKIGDLDPTKYRIITEVNNFQGTTVPFNKLLQKSYPDDVILIDDNVTMINKDWKEVLQDTAYSDSRIGVVTGAACNETRTYGRYTYTMAGLNPAYIKRRLINVINGFDEGFHSYGDEPDFCLRTHLAGFKVIKKDVRVYKPKKELALSKFDIRFFIDRSEKRMAEKWGARKV